MVIRVFNPEIYNNSMIALSERNNLRSLFKESIGYKKP